MQQTVTAADPEETASESAQAPVDDLEPQLKYERLGADVKSILRDASATCLCLSEKVLALGTSTGSIHILDYSGNEVSQSWHSSRPLFTSCTVCVAFKLGMLPGLIRVTVALEPLRMEHLIACTNTITLLNS